MSGAGKERNYIVGIYLSERDDQPRFRHLYSDIKSVRESIARWLREGYIHVVEMNKQDHYAPSQIYKVRILGITKVIIEPNSPEADEMGVNDEQAYWLDESGHQIDWHKLSM